MILGVLLVPLENWRRRSYAVNAVLLICYEYAEGPTYQSLWVNHPQAVYLFTGPSIFPGKVLAKKYLFPPSPFQSSSWFSQVFGYGSFRFPRTWYCSKKYLCQSLLITLFLTNHAHSHYFSHGPNFFIPGGNTLRRATIIISNKMHSISPILSPSTVDMLTWENQGITTTQKCPSMPVRLYPVLVTLALKV